MDESQQIVSDWLDFVDRAGDWVTADSLSPAARADSEMWCARFYRPEAGPWNAKLRARRSYHVARPDTLDLLRHDYTVAGIDLEIVESRMFSLARVLTSMRAGDAPQFAASILAPAWKFPPVSEGGIASTNPSAHPMMMKSWTLRADAGIRRGVLWFLGFKRVEQILGYASPTTWFEEPYRKA